MTPYIPYLVGGFMLAGAVSACLTPVFARLARQRGLVAYPNPDVVSHRSIIPLLGGAAVLLACLPGAVVVCAWAPSWCWLGLAIAPVLGLALYKDIVDDRIPPRLQLVIQVTSFTILVVGGFEVPWTGYRFLDVALSVILGVTILNAVNFLDVMDGLAGGVMAAICLGLGLVACAVHLPAPGLFAFSLAGAMLGFLIHNRPPAKVFLGDIGSFGIGFVVATLMLRLLGTPGAKVPSLVTMAVLFGELGYTSWCRIRRGRLPTHGDDAHLSLRLLSRGWPPKRILLMAYLLAGVCVSIGVLLATKTQ